MDSPNLVTIVVIVVVAAGVVSVLWRGIKQQRALQRELTALKQQQARSSSAEPSHAAAEAASVERPYVFLSHVREDDGVTEELQRHLTAVLRERNLAVWSPWNVGPFPDWQAAFRDAIAKSRLAIALVSPDYLASDAIRQELAVLIRAAKGSELRLFWIAVRPSAVEKTELGNYAPLSHAGEPLGTLDPKRKDVALAQIAEAVVRYLERAADEVLAPAPNALNAVAGLPMRLAKIRLQNIRCFEDIEVDLHVKHATNGTELPSLRTVLVGDNATGKSSLLRSIALGICDESGATSLLKNMKGKMVRSGATQGRIELTFCSDDSKRSLVAVTEIQPAPSGGEIVRKSGNPPPPLVLAGYGTQRTRWGNESHEQYDSTVAVGTLFDDSAVLQNPELVLLRQPRWIRQGILDVLAGVLGYKSGELEHVRDSIRIPGPWGQERLEVLSDGYRSTTQWVMDFMNWFVYAADTISAANDVAGIVLIDELEQHLHPQWQRLIVAHLRKQLPKVQFVLTTHSPLIASAVTGLDEDGWREKLFYLGMNEHKRIVPTESAALRGMNPQQVLASAAFDYLIDADPAVEEVYAEASRLASKGDKRTADEEKRYRRAKQIVGEMLQNQDTTLIERDARKDLNKQNEEKLKELKAAVFAKGKAP